jgi:hypothetical protein
MKYLKSYNESLRDLMTPKSEEEILKSLKKLNNSDLLKKSIKYEFIKGIESVNFNELTNIDIYVIQINIYFIKNKDIVRLLLDEIKDKLSEDQIYIIEKYKLGLHQNEETEYERWFKKMLTDSDISISKYYDNELIYAKNGIVLFIYNKKEGIFDINDDRIWSVFESKYNFNYDEIKLLTKNIVEKHLNLKNIITMSRTLN